MMMMVGRPDEGGVLLALAAQGGFVRLVVVRAAQVPVRRRRRVGIRGCSVGDVVAVVLAAVLGDGFAEALVPPLRVRAARRGSAQRDLWRGGGVWGQSCLHVFARFVLHGLLFLLSHQKLLGELLVAFHHSAHSCKKKPAKYWLSIDKYLKTLMTQS